MDARQFLYKIFVKLLLPFRVAFRFELNRELSLVNERLVKTVGAVKRLESQLEVQNLASATKYLACIESAKFITKYMPHAKAFQTQNEVMEYAISVANFTANSVVMEFGVYKGESVNHIAKTIKNRIIGFDSFEGLPENWRTGFEAGTFALPAMPVVEENVELVKGLFADSLPQFLVSFRQPISLIHIDCDLYSSTIFVLDQLEEFILPGCILVFDEFFNYPGWEVGEYKAFNEFVRRTGLKFDYIAYNSMHEQVVVRVL